MHGFFYKSKGLYKATTSYTLCVVFVMLTTCHKKYNKHSLMYVYNYVLTVFLSCSSCMKEVSTLLAAVRPSDLSVVVVWFRPRLLLPPLNSLTSISDSSSEEMLGFFAGMISTWLSN